jgi:hypothetical protein
VAAWRFARRTSAPEGAAAQGPQWRTSVVVAEDLQAATGVAAHRIRRPTRNLHTQTSADPRWAMLRIPMLHVRPWSRNRPPDFIRPAEVARMSHSRRSIQVARRDREVRPWLHVRRSILRRTSIPLADRTCLVAELQGGIVRTRATDRATGQAQVSVSPAQGAIIRASGTSIVQPPCQLT